MDLIYTGEGIYQIDMGPLYFTWTELQRFVDFLADAGDNPLAAKWLEEQMEVAPR